MGKRLRTYSLNMPKLGNLLLSNDRKYLALYEFVYRKYE
jgi:hypothetical protein